MSTLEQLLSDIFDDLDAVDDDTLFRQYEGWDSLKHVQLVVSIEHRLHIDLTAEEIRRMTSRRALREVLSARGLDV